MQYVFLIYLVYLVTELCFIRMRKTEQVPPNDATYARFLKRSVDGKQDITLVYNEIDKGILVSIAVFLLVVSSLCFASFIGVYRVTGNLVNGDLIVSVVVALIACRCMFCSIKPRQYKISLGQDGCSLCVPAFSGKILWNDIKDIKCIDMSAPPFGGGLIALKVDGLDAERLSALSCIMRFVYGSFIVFDSRRYSVKGQDMFSREEIFSIVYWYWKEHRNTE